mgnify:CR=1 FL=1
MRIAIVEDEPRYRASLRAVFELAPGFEVAADYADPQAALEAASAAEDPGWDLVLMDVELPGIDGVEATRRLKKHRPGIRVVMLTIFEEPATVLEAICAGADGYLLKRSTATELVDELQHIDRGGAPMTPRVAKSMLSLVRSLAPHTDSRSAPTLSPREQQVLRGLVDGRSYKQVAADLEVSIDTVRGHIRRLYRKLQVHSVAEAVTRALRERLV